MPVKTITLSDEEWDEANGGSRDNVMIGGGTEISECGTLDQENATYVLQNDIDVAVSCFDVQAHGVTLNLNEHTVKGVTAPAGTRGVVVDGYDDVFIRNGRLENWYEGIYLRNVQDSVVTGITTSGNSLGVSFDSVSDSRVYDSVFSANTGHGIKVKGSGNIIGNNVLAGNGNTGMTVSGSHNIIQGNTIVGNQNAGIYISSGLNNSVLDNIANGTLAGTGIDIGLNANQNRIWNNVANGNQEYGIHLISNSENNVVDNIAEGNYIGIAVNYSTLNTLTDNSAAFSGSHGIALKSVTFSNFERNNASFNQEDGFTARGSSDNQFVDNIVLRNDNYGFELQSSTNGNTLDSNIICQNVAADLYCSSAAASNTYVSNMFDLESGFCSAGPAIPCS
ncbi:hypothetical protein CMI37_38750 [Candidatus Pacearchaeota archaeon]|nr:hypothetical protein [Candidatus Pacearchaeota archaeon]